MAKGVTKVVAVAALSIALLLSCSVTERENADHSYHGEQVTAENQPGQADQELLYGVIPADYIEEAGRVGRNQVISSIIMSAGFSYQEALNITANIEGTFDPARVRSGNRYIFFRKDESAQRPSYMVYEHDRRLSYIFRLKDDPAVFDYQYGEDYKLKFISGTIESSLWNAVANAGGNTLLAIELAEIYAWNIDFFALKPGDHFNVVYEEVYRRGDSDGIAMIHGALFNHAGRDMLAIPFRQDSTTGYFDEEGNSLRREFLKAPLTYTRISSGFSHSRMHPILRVRRPHLGVDYAAPAGTPVVSIGDGVVTSTAYEAAAGRIVRIRHNSVYSTAYMHLQSFGPGIRAGVPVKQGQVIGYVGSSGLATGPHLDFRVFRHGTPVDPLRVESPPVDPVRDENRERFAVVKEVIVPLLISAGIEPEGASLLSPQ